MRRIFIVLLGLVLIWPAAGFGGIDFQEAGTSDYGVVFNSGVGVRQFSIMSYSADIEMTLYLDSVPLETVTVLARMVFEPTILCDSIGVDRTSSTAVLCIWNEFQTRDVASARISYGLAGDIVTPDGILSDPDLTAVTLCSNVDIAAGDSVEYSWDMAAYWECYAKCLATTFDAAVVYVATSQTLGWPTGNTAYFDRDPSTVAVEHWALDDGLGVYGTCFPLMNTYGAFLIGPYGCIKVKADAGCAIEDLTIIIELRK